MYSAAILLPNARIPHPLRLTTMSDDTRRDTPTDVAPPIGDEPETQPPAGSAEARSVTIPRAARVPQLSDAIRDASVDQLLRMYQAAQLREHDLLDADGKLAKLNEDRATRIKAETVEELSKVVDQLAGAPVRDLAARFTKLEQKDVEQDNRLAGISTELAALTGRIGTMERIAEGVQMSAKFQEEFRDVKTAIYTIVDLLESASADKAQLAGRKVLLLDDQELICKALTRVLSARGATVFTASTIAVAKELFQRFQPECALIDIRLSGDEDGTTFAQWLLEQGVDPARVLLMSGDNTGARDSLAGHLGLRLLDKPMGNSDLALAVRSACATRPS